MKLVNMVEIMENNVNCVVLKVKDNMEMNLICLGCFNGQENVIRLTKGGTHTCTIWEKNGKHYSWQWGDNGTTLVEELTRQKGNLIQSCITEDLDIYIDKKADMILKTLHTKMPSCTRHQYKLMWWGKDINKEKLCVHKDGEYFKHSQYQDFLENFVNVDGCEVLYEKSYKSPNTGCNILEMYIVKESVA